MYRSLVGKDETYTVRLEILERLARLPTREATKLLLSAAAAEETDVRGRQLVGHVGHLLSSAWHSAPRWVTYGRDALELYRDRPRAEEAVVIALRLVRIQGGELPSFDADIAGVFERTNDPYVRGATVLAAGEFDDVTDGLRFLRGIAEGEWGEYTDGVTYPLASLARRSPGDAGEIGALLVNLAMRPQVNRGAFNRIVDTIQRIHPESLHSLLTRAASRGPSFRQYVVNAARNRSEEKR